MNTQFSYMYQGNEHYSFVFEGEISKDQLCRFVELCDGDDIFVPRALCLPGGVLEDDEEYDPVVDTCWCTHEFENSFKLVAEKPTVWSFERAFGELLPIMGMSGATVKIDVFLEAFEKCASQEWENALFTPINLLEYKLRQENIEEKAFEEADFDLDLPKSISISAATLALDTDSIYEDEEELSDIVSDYLSDTYGYCHCGFSMKVLYNEFDEPSDIVVTNIEWDIDELEEDSLEEKIASANEQKQGREPNVVAREENCR